MISKLFVLFLGGALVLSSCRSISADESSNFSANEQMDSIKKSELSVKPFLVKKQYLLNSGLNIELYVPYTMYLDDSFQSLHVYLVDPYEAQENNLNEEDEIIKEDQISNFYTICMKSNLVSDGDFGRIRIEDSKDSTLYSIESIKKANRIEKLIMETPNALIFQEPFDDFKVFVRFYNKAEGRYYLFSSTIEKSPNMVNTYQAIFRSYNLATHLFALDEVYANKEINWNDIKKTVSPVEEAELNRYYGSIGKDAKYFMRNDGDFSYLGYMDLFLFRNDKGNLLEELEVIKDFQDISSIKGLPSSYYDYLENNTSRESELSFTKRLSPNTILLTIKSDGFFSDDPPEYKTFILSSFKTKDGKQLYLSSKSKLDSLTPLINDYFVSHLSL